MRLHPLVYAQVSAQMLCLTKLQSGRTWAHSPNVAIDQSTFRVLGFGADAEAAAGPGVVVVNGFAEIARGIINDFDAAEIVLRHGVMCLLGQGPMNLKPDFVLHPVDIAPQFASELCADALRRLREGIGARKCAVWFGGELDRTSAEELLGRAS